MINFKFTELTEPRYSAAVKANISEKQKKNEIKKKLSRRDGDQGMSRSEMKSFRISGTSIQGSPLGPIVVSPERRLGWGLLIINQQIKFFSFCIRPENLLQSQ